MAVTRVVINADVYMVCLAHALSTEKEEIMGLLIGDVSPQKSVHVSSLVTLQRSDKKPDRVEISPEQLSDATVLAERLSNDLERPMRVVGWYHSHPHITVWPSHVDVRTQSMYQFMDDSFVGIIFSVFNTEKHVQGSKLQVTCFQSKSHGGSAGEYTRLDVPMYVGWCDSVEPSNLERMSLLPQVLIDEETVAHDAAMATDPECALTAADFLVQLHNASVYNQSLCRILEVLSSPIVQLLESKLKHNRAMIVELKEEQRRLRQQASP